MLFFWMDSFLNQNGKVLEETLAGSNSNAVKTTLRGLPNSKMTLPFCNFLKNLSPFLGYLVGYNSLGTWAGLMNQSVI